jgi:hypothetical protein
MSVSAKDRTGVLPAGEGAGTASGRDIAGLVFAQLSVVPALLAMSWLMAGLPFLWAGRFQPVPVTVLATLLAVPVLWFGLRAVPGLPGRAAMALPGEDRRTPWWPLAAVAVIAVAFFAQQKAYHAQYVMILGDPGAYIQFAAWLARHGSLPVPTDAAVFGGTHGGLLTFASPAAYAPSPGTVVLQFMAGLPTLLAGTMWAGGYRAALLMGPLLGTLAVVTFAGLTARLAGARWAPLAALVVALSLPMQYTSRATYSEPLAEILLLGGLALVLDGLRDGRAAREARAAAGLGGLALGLAVLVRIDGVSDVLPVIPFCGAMFVRRRPQAGWLTAGLAVGTVIGVGEGLVFSWPYLMVTNRISVLPLAWLLLAVIVATAAGTWFFRRRPLPRFWGWLPDTALAGAFALVLAFGVRPHFQHVWGVNNGGHQIRSYAELSLHWVDWYLGLPVIFAATIGAGLLARRCLQGRAGYWALPLMVLSWAAVTFLYRPGITPGQPWASRRMVPEVIPAFALLAVWAIARGTAWVGAARTSRLGNAARAGARLRPALVVACALAVTLPAVVANWGLGVSPVSKGILLRVDGLAVQRDYQGELTALRELCAAIPGNAAAIFITDEGQKLMQNVRATCGVPAVQVAAWNSQGQQVMTGTRLAGVVRSVVASAERAGRVPVLLAENESDLQPYQATGVVRHVFTLQTTADPSVIYGVPKSPLRLRLEIWIWRPSFGRPAA